MDRRTLQRKSMVNGSPRKNPAVLLLLGKVARSKSPRSPDHLSLRQRQRRRPSRVKSRPHVPGTPSENLKLALEHSDLCYALRDAGRKTIRWTSD